MGKGAWSGVIEYVSVGFHAILLFRLWFQTLNNVVMEAGKASSHHPEILETELVKGCARTSLGSSETYFEAELETGELEL